MYIALCILKKCPQKLRSETEYFEKSQGGVGGMENGDM